MVVFFLFYNQRECSKQPFYSHIIKKIKNKSQEAAVPERVATVLLGEVDFVRGERYFLFDVYDRASSGETRHRERLLKNLNKKNTGNIHKYKNSTTDT